MLSRRIPVNLGMWSTIQRQRPIAILDMIARPAALLSPDSVSGFRVNLPVLTQCGPVVDSLSNRNEYAESSWR
jgi:hypothetical protein